MRLGLFPALTRSDDWASVHILLAGSASMVLPRGQRCWQPSPLVSPGRPVTTLGRAEGRVGRGVPSATPCRGGVSVCTPLTNRISPASYSGSHAVSTPGAKSKPRYCPQTQVWISASRRSSPCASATAATTGTWTGKRKTPSSAERGTDGGRRAARWPGRSPREPIAGGARTAAGSLNQGEV